jgi:subtilisin family serine protease
LACPAPSIIANVTVSGHVRQIAPADLDKHVFVTRTTPRQLSCMTTVYAGALGFVRLCHTVDYISGHLVLRGCGTAGVDILAPGDRIVSAYQGRSVTQNTNVATLSGTSMASPHVAGEIDSE